MITSRSPVSKGTRTLPLVRLKAVMGGIRLKAVMGGNGADYDRAPGARAPPARSRDSRYPPPPPVPPADTTWVPQPCSSSDMSAASMQSDPGKGAAAAGEVLPVTRVPLHGVRKLTENAGSALARHAATHMADRL
jgi:hypothetical protein